jgi:lipopolysaccharide biosynthesis protein
MVGPFAPVEDLLGRARGAGQDVWAVTSSLQLTPHLQTYFLRFAPGVLARPELVRFFDGVRHLTNKVAIVRRYELGLTRAVNDAGLGSAVGFPAATLGAGRDNPTLVSWRELMEAGYPFFKRTLLRDPRVMVDANALRDAVGEIFGVDPAPFLEDLG